MAKLEAYGVTGLSLRWFEWYLTNRKQKTEILNNYLNFSSDWGMVLAGIPQGSVLDPILFDMYINDLLLSVSAEIIQFADDMKAITRANSVADQSNLIRNVSSRLADWYKINGFVLNDAKTSVVFY